MFFDLLTPETMKLPESTKNKTTKEKKVKINLIYRLLE